MDEEILKVHAGIMSLLNVSRVLSNVAIMLAEANAVRRDENVFSPWKRVFGETYEMFNALTIFVQYFRWFPHLVPPRLSNSSHFSLQFSLTATTYTYLLTCITQQLNVNTASQINAVMSQSDSLGIQIHRTLSFYGKTDIMTLHANKKKTLVTRHHKLFISFPVFPLFNGQ